MKVLLIVLVVCWILALINYATTSMRWSLYNSFNGYLIELNDRGDDLLHNPDISSYQKGSIQQINYIIDLSRRRTDCVPGFWSLWYCFTDKACGLSDFLQVYNGYSRQRKDEWTKSLWVMSRGMIFAHFFIIPGFSIFMLIAVRILFWLSHHGFRFSWLSDNWDNFFLEQSKLFYSESFKQYNTLILDIEKLLNNSKPEEAYSDSFKKKLNQIFDKNKDNN